MPGRAVVSRMILAYVRRGMLLAIALWLVLYPRGVVEEEINSHLIAYWVPGEFYRQKRAVPEKKASPGASPVIPFLGLKPLMLPDIYNNPGTRVSQSSCISHTHVNRASPMWGPPAPSCLALLSDWA